MSPSSTHHGSQYDTKYLVCDIGMAIACGIHGGHNLGHLASTTVYLVRDYVIYVPGVIYDTSMWYQASDTGMWYPGLWYLVLWCQTWCVMGVDLPVKDTVPVPPLVLIGILYYSSNYILRSIHIYYSECIPGAWYQYVMCEGRLCIHIIAIIVLPFPDRVSFASMNRFFFLTGWKGEKNGGLGELLWRWIWSFGLLQLGDEDLLTDSSWSWMVGLLQVEVWDLLTDSSWSWMFGLLQVEV